VTLHSTTLRYSVVPAVLAELTRRRHHLYRSTALTSSILFSRA
jgi:hypothetical protein